MAEYTDIINCSDACVNEQLVYEQYDFRAVVDTKTIRRVMHFRCTKCNAKCPTANLALVHFRMEMMVLSGAETRIPTAVYTLDDVDEQGKEIPLNQIHFQIAENTSSELPA